ncbi:MAG: hypothetical protein QOG23_1928 [Blastocatellia bacterium]|jgi:hypothetical protein|nr:hypothetical protein [Blastocatellia bacterium]
MPFSLVCLQGENGSWETLADLCARQISGTPHIPDALHRLTTAHLHNSTLTLEADFADAEKTPRSLREVEAEAVAFLFCEALELEGRITVAGICRTGSIKTSAFTAPGSPWGRLGTRRLPRSGLSFLLRAIQTASSVANPTKSKTCNCLTGEIAY